MFEQEIIYYQINLLLLIKIMINQFNAFNKTNGIKSFLLKIIKFQHTPNSFFLNNFFIKICFIHLITFFKFLKI